MSSKKSSTAKLKRRPYDNAVAQLDRDIIDPYAIEFHLSCLRDDPATDLSQCVNALNRFLRRIRLSVAQSVQEHMEAAVARVRADEEQKKKKEMGQEQDEDGASKPDPGPRCLHIETCLRVQACRQPEHCQLGSRQVELGDMERVVRELLIEMRLWPKGRTTVDRLALAWWRVAAYVCAPALINHPVETRELRTQAAQNPRKPERKCKIQYRWASSGKLLVPCEEEVEYVIDQDLVKGLREHFLAEHGHTQGDRKKIAKVLGLSIYQVDGYLVPANKPSDQTPVSAPHTEGSSAA